jgi:hypothetical protein
MALADSCAQNAAALKRRGLLLTDGELSGIVPDGVSRVTIRDQSEARQQQRRTVGVVNNVFATNIDLPSADERAVTMTAPVCCDRRSSRVWWARSSLSRASLC